MAIWQTLILLIKAYWSKHEYLSVSSLHLCTVPTGLMSKFEFGFLESVGSLTKPTSK